MGQGEAWGARVPPSAHPVGEAALATALDGERQRNLEAGGGSRKFYPESTAPGALARISVLNPFLP